MNKKELSQLLKLKSEIKMLKEQLVDLRQSLTAVNKSEKSDSVQGSSKSLPYALHNISIIGLSDDDIGQKARIRKGITSIKADIQMRADYCVREYKRLNDFISGVEDSEIRQILTLRYIEGLNWDNISARIGFEVSKESVRKAHDRFLRKTDKYR